MNHTTFSLSAHLLSKFLQHATSCLIVLALFLSSDSTAQPEQPEELVARLDLQTYHNPSPQYKTFVSDFISLNNILEYKEAFPGAMSESLKRTQVIKPSNKESISLYKNILENSGFFDRVEIIYSGVSPGYGHPSDEVLTECNDPHAYNDPGALATEHIEKMELPCAWSISHGCPEITVGVIDEFFADNHPDLQGKFIEIKGGCSPAHAPICGHG